MFGNNYTALLSMLCKQDPEAIFNNLLQTNPQFKDFVEKNKGKPIEQIANECGVPMQLLSQFTSK